METSMRGEEGKQSRQTEQCSFYMHEEIDEGSRAQDFRKQVLGAQGERKVSKSLPIKTKIGCK